VDGYANRWSSIATTDIPKFQQAAEKANLHVLIVSNPAVATAGEAK